MIKENKDEKKYILSVLDIFLIIIHIILLIYMPLALGYTIDTASEMDFKSYFMLIEFIGYVFGAVMTAFNLIHLILLNIAEYREAKEYAFNKTAICFDGIDEKGYRIKHYVDKKYLSDSIIEQAKNT